MPNYADVHVPDATPLEELNTTSRRARLLDRLKERGHPDGINQTELADEFNVHPSTISRDFDALREEIAENVGDEADIVTHEVYRDAVDDLMADGRHDEALDLLDDWNRWLFGDDSGQSDGPHSATRDATVVLRKPPATDETVGEPSDGR